MMTNIYIYIYILSGVYGSLGPPQACNPEVPSSTSCSLSIT